MSNDTGYQDQPLLAELYDLVPLYQERSDINFYTDYCHTVSGEILELGCETGRVLIPIAQAGQAITGLDLSENMLNQCRANIAKQPGDVAQRINLVQADMTRFKIDRLFSLAIIPFRPFQHILSTDAQMACLRSIHDHLIDTGQLIIDLFQVNMKFMVEAQLDEEIENVPETKLPDGRSLRRTHRFVAKHPARQYNDIEIIYYLTGTDGKTERVVQAFPFRYYFRYEVEHLLARCGFKVVDLFGNMDKSPLTDSSPEMIFVAEKS